MITCILQDASVRQRSNKKRIWTDVINIVLKENGLDDVPEIELRY